MTWSRGWPPVRMACLRSPANRRTLTKGWNVRRVFSIYAAIVQLAAILLLQYYPLASHLSQTTTQPHCMGNHAQCGCAPERIASRTCCCYQQRPGVGDADRHHDGERVSRHENDPAIPALCAAPCGSSPKFVTASLEKLKFLCIGALLQIPAAYALVLSPAPLETVAGRFSEPPDPPPKLALLA